MRRLVVALVLLFVACGAADETPTESQGELTLPTVPTTEESTVRETLATTTLPPTTLLPVTVPTTRATTTTATRQPTAAPSGCHPSYRGACVPADASDVDCEGGSGNGPAYTGRVEVVGPDEYDLDRDGNGVGCE